jgi:signal transduction histidine kinase
MEARMISAGERQSRLKNPIRILHLDRTADQSSLVKRKLKAEAVPCVLRRMRQRVAALGGTLEIISAPAQGTEVRIKIPLDQ